MSDVSINVSTAAAVADAIEAHKKKLAYQLDATKDAVSGLSGTWKTPNSSIGRTNYALYASKNFSSFCESIQGYAIFLREQVCGGYTETENSNEDLADMYE